MNVKKIAQKCRESQSEIGILSTDIKNNILREMAGALQSQTEKIIAANHRDVKAAQKEGLSPAMIDRLVLNEKRIGEMTDGLEDVAKLPDPVGLVVREWERPNGLKVQKKRIPLGVIAVVYESRPNVTVDAAGLCFKSGNAVLLRGGSEAIHSNLALAGILQKVLYDNKVPKEAISIIPVTDRGALREMLGLSRTIDVIIPRGGESLMKFMEAHSKIPIIKHDKGVCNLFVDETADTEMALRLIDNSKVQRPGVCNALENLFVHEKIAPTFLPKVASLLIARGVQLRGDAKAKKIVPSMRAAVKKDWETEYLDLILSVGVVRDVDAAIDLIRKYGSRHTEAIVTQTPAHAEKFVNQLDSSCVLVNASTRFNDGGQLGLGAEIGISTTKLHAFGPMGLEELTTTKFVVHGEGQIRT